jgi:hypothetical protein
LSVPSLARFKTCTKCGLTYPATTDYFHTGKQLKFSLQNACKVCRRADNRRWLAENKERRREYNQQWEVENRERRAEMFRVWQQENAEARREYNERWRQENVERIKNWPSQRLEVKREAANRSYWKRRDEISERVKEDRRENPGKYRRYYENHKEKYGKDYLNKRAARYREANRERLREKWRVHAHKRRTRKNPEAGYHTYAEIWQMIEDQEHLCAYCEVPLFGEFEIDHMTPVSRGGGNTWENIAIVCKPCNRSKYDKTVEEFIDAIRGGAA